MKLIVIALLFLGGCTCIPVKGDQAQCIIQKDRNNITWQCQSVGAN